MQTHDIKNKMHAQGHVGPPLPLGHVLGAVQWAERAPHCLVRATSAVVKLSVAV